MTSRTPTRQPSWLKSTMKFMLLMTLVCASSKIAVEAKIPSASAAARSRVALSNTNHRQHHHGASSAKGWSNGLSHIQMLQNRMTIGTVLTTVRGGDVSSDDEESSDEEDEYDSSDEEEEEEYDTTDSEDEYDTDEEEESSSEEEDEKMVSQITQSSLKSSMLSKSKDDSSDDDEIIEYDDLLTPPAMQQFILSIGVMMLSNRIDILNEKAVRIARFAFVAYILGTQLFLLYVRIRAKAINDRTTITITNPLASLAENAAGGVGGAGGNFMVKALADQVLSTTTTIYEYDMKQAKKMNSSLLFPMVFLYFLHFKMKQVQPLLQQTISGVAGLVYSPLFQVYVLGRNLERPFKPPSNPMMEAMQAQQQGQEESEEGDGGEEEEEGEVEEGEEEADDESEGEDESESEEDASEDEEEDGSESEDEYDSDSDEE